MLIGLLSDTHSFLDEKIFNHFSSCDEIWHAGDIGDESVAKQLSNFKPLRAVYGNIDGTNIRTQFPENLSFKCEEIKVLITHIGGNGNWYAPPAQKLIDEIHPNIFICGHSHICKVQHDKKNNMLYLNPGAAGKSGFHKIRTILRFSIKGSDISDMDVIELGLRSAL
jgi:putative phosphoesterase